MSGRDDLGAAYLDGLATGYKECQILVTANRLGLFAAVAEAARGLDELAGELGADRRGLRILCDALVAMELLVKDGDGRYAPSRLARDHLTPDAPRPRGAMLHHTAKLYERWAGLYDAVLQGRPVPEDAIDERLRGDAGSFTRAMGDVARESARTTLDRLDLAGVDRFLDLGGGPGSYALEAARRRPGLRATVFDRSEVLAHTRRNIAAAGLEARVGVAAGDAFADDLGGPWDLILISNLIHIYGDAENRALVARCAGALAPGGRLAIKDFLLSPDRTAPRGAAVFAVNMLVSTDRGDCHPVSEVHDWMRAAGLEPGDTVDLTGQSSLAVARRPA